ncbi:MAG: hypothetical protein ACK2UM_20180 [Anaerolineales bacterium]|jgi:hypothetical protein
MNNLMRTAYLMLICGTAGLLVNEFIFGWGRTATLISAALSLLGLIILGVFHLAEKVRQNKNKI